MKLMGKNNEFNKNILTLNAFCIIKSFLIFLKLLKLRIKKLDKK